MEFKAKLPFKIVFGLSSLFFLGLIVMAILENSILNHNVLYAIIFFLSCIGVLLMALDEI
ncbi:MAG: hypothetical protein Ta2G_11100 [Termitinemataceae bacterium]|nr:MAG: hypothetical protein Ta2G_11100 [Termitinemataceae bacterium]